MPTDWRGRPAQIATAARRQVRSSMYGLFRFSTPVAAKNYEVLFEDEGNIGSIRSPANGRNPDSQAPPKGAHCDGLPLLLKVHAAFLRFLPRRPLTGAPTP